MKALYSYLVFIALLLTLDVNARVITVNNANDSNYGHCESNCSFRDAISIATQNDVIQFDADYNIDLKEQLIITNKNFTIDAGQNNITINGQDKVRVFQLENSIITINNLTIINGRAIENGGGILVTDSLLTLNDSVVSGNMAASGGGIFNSATSNTTINNSIISDNAAFAGENIYSNGGNLQVVDTFIAMSSSNLFGTVTYLNQIDGIVADLQIIQDSFKSGKSRSVRDGHIPPLDTGTDPLPPEEGTDPLPPEEGTDPLPPEEGTDPLSPEEGTDPLSPEEGTDPLPTEEETDPLPTEEETDPLPTEEETDPLSPEEGTDPLPTEEETDLPPRPEDLGIELGEDGENLDNRPKPPEEGTDPLPPEEGTDPLSPEEGTDPLPPEEGTDPLPTEEETDPLSPEEGTDPLPREEGTDPLPPEEGTDPLPPEEGTDPLPPEEGAGDNLNDLIQSFEDEEFEFELDEFEEFEISVDEIADMDITKLAQIDTKSFNNLLPEHLNKMPPNALQAMTPEQRANISKDAMNGLTKEQIDGMPREVLDDLFKADKLAGLNSALIHELGMEHLDKNEVQQMSDEDASMFFSNLDNAKISNEEAKSMLPKDWKIDDETGDIVPPPGAKISMKEIDYSVSKAGLSSESSKVVMPKVPNLGVGRGLGGSGTPVIEHMQNSLSKNINLSQNDTTGILNVEDKDENGEVKGNYAFLPDKNNIVQIDTNTSSSDLSTDQGCFYKVTTSEGQQIRVIPTVKDPDDLYKVINNGQIIYGEQGDLFMDVQTKTRDSSSSRSVVIVDSLIEPAPDSWCITDESTGEETCDYGIVYSTTRAKQRTAKIIYSDGTSQKIMPTVFKPNTLIEKGLTFSGVEGITFNVNGTFTVVYKGEKYLLVPNFDIRTTDVPTGKTVTSKLVFNKQGGLTYTVGVDLSNSTTTTTQIALMFDLSIELFVEDPCKIN